MAGWFTPRLAPNWLRQVINPWQFFQGAQFGFINIELGQTPHPEVEQAILDEVGSYVRQLGRIGDALEVLLKNVELNLARLRRMRSQSSKDNWLKCDKSNVVH